MMTTSALIANAVRKTMLRLAIDELNNYEPDGFCFIHEQDRPCPHCQADEMDRRYDEQRDRGAQ